MFLSVAHSALKPRYLACILDQTQNERIRRCMRECISVEGSFEIESKMEEQDFNVVCKERGGKLKVFFETNASKEEVLKSITQITGQNKVAFDCVKINKIPRTSSGKVDYLKIDWSLNA